MEPGYSGNRYRIVDTGESYGSSYEEDIRSWIIRRYIRYTSAEENMT